MSRPSFAFRALGVRRMPGITDGGWELPGLSPGVNVVWGPNGAGKTTTASAVERLLWPAAFRDGRPQLDARVVLDGAEWRVELDGDDAPLAARRARRGRPRGHPVGHGARPLPHLPARAAERKRTAAWPRASSTNPPAASTWAPRRTSSGSARAPAIPTA